MFSLLNENKTDKNRNKTTILRAFRNIVFENSVKFKESREDIKCESCNNLYNIQVNHLPPNVFSKLVDDFILEKELKFYDIEVYGEDEHYEIDKFIFYNDKEITEEWKTFHNTRAKFNLLCSRCNRKFNSYGYRHHFGLNKNPKPFKFRTFNEVHIQTRLLGAENPKLNEIGTRIQEPVITGFQKNQKNKEINIF